MGLLLQEDFAFPLFSSREENVVTIHMHSLQTQQSSSTVSVNHQRINHLGDAGRPHASSYFTMENSFDFNIALKKT